MLIGAIDIGGTSIKSALINENGELTEQKNVRTDAARGGEHVMDKVLSVSDGWPAHLKLDGIAISSAGQVDPGRGEIVFATESIPGYTGMNVSERIMEHVKLPVTIENDVNCTALGERWLGAAKGIDDFLTITLGTGIGGALFLNGSLYRGTNFSGGEVGHMVLYPGGKPCTCSQVGCYEQYASSAALASIVNHEFGEMDLPLFFDLVRSRNKKAEVLFLKWIDDLTTGLGSLIHILNPSAVVIGGGITAQGNLLQDAVQLSLKSKLMPNQNNLSVMLAEKGNDANLLGAVAHFLNTFPSNKHK